MLSLRLSLVPNIGGYRTSFVNLTDAPSTIAVSLEDGTHTFESEEFDLGVLASFENRRLLGRVVFTYTYDEARHTITVCGSDFASQDAMRLVTFPAGTEEYCLHWAARSTGFAADDFTTYPHWNCRTPLTPGLEEVLQRIARAANNSLIAELEACPDVIVRVRKLPPEISVEDYRQTLLLYRDGEFQGLHEPGRVLGPQDAIRTIDSVWGGTVKFNPNEQFANVIGSSGDPHIASKTWIRLWADQFGVYPNICTSYRFNRFNCGTTIVGGHVVTGTAARAMPVGSNAVYIFPICHDHNMDNTVYMEALQYHNGIWLKDYLGP